MKRAKLLCKKKLQIQYVPTLNAAYSDRRTPPNTRLLHRIRREVQRRRFASDHANQSLDALRTVQPMVRDPRSETRGQRLEPAQARAIALPTSRIVDCCCDSA